MSNTIKIKRGSSVPSSSDLENYELGYRTGTTELYINDGGNYRQLGGNTFTTAAVSDGATTLATGNAIYDHVTNRISGLATTASLGDLATLDDIPANKVSSGTLADARIPNLAASKITSGTIPSARLDADTAHLSGTQTFSGAKTFSADINGATQMQLTAAAPRYRLQESGVTNTPNWWMIADGGNYSIRLNNSGTYPLTITTDSDNDAVVSITLGYSTSITGTLETNNRITSTGNGGWTIGNYAGYDRIQNSSNSFSFLTDGNAYANTFASTVYAASKLQTAGFVEIVKTGSTGCLLRLNNSGWSNATTHDIIYNSWLSNLGDYTYLKSAGNSGSGHGIAVVADEVFAVGDTNIETGVLTNSATAPFTDTWFTVNGSGNAILKGSLTLGGYVLNLPNTGDWSYIKNDTNSGGLRFGTKDSGGTYANQIEISNTGNFVKLNENTTVNGNLTVTGTASVSSVLYGNQIDLTGELNFTGNGNKIIDVETLEGSNSFRIRNHNTVGNVFHDALKLVGNGGAHLYYNNSKKLETTNTGATVTGNIVVSGTVDGRDVASDGSKLDGIESGATADQTITLTGDVTGSGTGSFATTIVDDSHNHSWLNSNTNDPGDSRLQYWQAANNTTINPTSDWYTAIRMGHGDPVTYYGNTLAIKMTGSGSGTIYTRNLSNGTQGSWFKHWHDGNDGAGSGLDADNLDGTTWTGTDKTVRWDNGRGYHGNPRSMAIGYSGGNYGQFGYNIEFTTTSNTHNYAFNDIATRCDLYDGLVVYTSGSGGSGQISWTELLDCRNNVFTYKGSQIPTMANGSDNRVMTSNDAYSLNGESGLTFDGNHLDITNGHLILPYGEINDAGTDVVVKATNGYLIQTGGANTRYNLTNSGTHNIYGNTSFSSPMSVNYGAVFNVGSHDSDFRVESNGKTHAIHVDAGSDKVNIDAAFWSNYGHRIGGLSQQGGFGTGTSQLFTTNNIMTFADNTNWAGAMVINTNITRSSSRMCTITVKGYGYGNQAFIDFDVNFYTYSGATGQDGVSGYPYVARINDRGNDKKKKFIGVNSAGKIAIAIGDYNDANKYYYGFKVSLDNHLNGSGATAYQEWTVTQSTTDGFGWLHKEEPARQILGIASQDATYTKILNPEGAVSMYLGDTGDGNNYYQAGEHRFRNYAGNAFYARIGNGYIRSEGNGSEAAPAFSFQGDTNTGIYLSGADDMAFVAGGYERFAANGNGLDLSNGSVNKIVMPAAQSRDKYRVWNSSYYCIGMDADYTFGALTGYAMTFQMNDEDGRGWWWGHHNHSKSSNTTTTGAMSLDTNGKLALAHSMRIGYGESDTTAPGASYRLDVSGSIGATADVVAYISSDKRLKDNIKNIANPLDKLNKLNGVEFDWNDKQDLYKGHDIGVIAQEVEEVLPEIVDTREDGHKAVKYDRMVALLIEAVKEQQVQINELKTKLGE